jgi:hypothetical protein
VQNVIKKLGLIREPWQAGAYAHLMTRAHDITGGKEFLAEARTAIETLMEHTDYRVKNEVYDRRYTEVAGFPLTELFGNAYGIAAAYRMYEVTDDPKFLRYSRDFMNTLLRLTFWYEDETDAVSRELGNAGLFYPHGGAHVATPWETSEANLMIAWALKHDRKHPLTELLLKLSNLNRVNSFHFFPAFWTKPVLALEAKERPAHGKYFPIEPFYCLEGTGGHHGATAGYMAGLALWNDWLYEALAVADNREILVLNLDATDDQEVALSGARRNFIVFNPTKARATFNLRVKALPEGEYSVNFTVASGTRIPGAKFPAAKLAEGIGLSLDPMDHARVTVSRADGKGMSAAIAASATARDKLCLAYQRVQCAIPVTAGEQQKTKFAAAMEAYRAGNPATATRLAEEILRALPANAAAGMPQLKAVEKGGTFAAGLTNLALASAGAVAFAKDDIGKDFKATGLNDGSYGHARHCWIGSSPGNHAGVILARPATINRIAFGTNNLPGGAHQNRHTGWWELQYTTDPKPTAESVWLTLGWIFKRAEDGPQRNLYAFEAIPGVTAVRLKVDRAGAMVDELEVYGETKP